MTAATTASGSRSILFFFMRLHLVTTMTPAATATSGLDFFRRFGMAATATASGLLFTLTYQGLNHFQHLLSFVLL